MPLTHHTIDMTARQVDLRILIRSLLCILFIFSGLCSYAQLDKPSSVKLRIKGEVEPNSQTSSLMIIRQNDNPHNPTGEIPITDGKIDYVFETSEPDLFTLISCQDLFEKGVCMPMEFFAENGEISLTGKDIDDDQQCLKLTIAKSSAPLNKRLIELNAYRKSNFTDRLDSIITLIDNMPEDEFYSAEGARFFKGFNALMEKIAENPDSLPLLQQRNEMFQKMESMRKDRSLYSDAYIEISNQISEVNNEMLDYEIETFGTADGDLFCLSILCDDFLKAYDNDSVIKRILDVYTQYFKDRFSNTAMGRRMNESVTGFEINRVGGQYPDYELPDADGNMHSIKDLINAQIVLIDLWGSTCGPCRVNSRSMIPIYEEFRDKGFDIIGIAREYHDLIGFHQALEKDGYPWIQLIELDDATGIFNLHGIPNSMGGTYLVGPSDSDPNDIRVLLVKPTPEEVREFLSNYFSSDN